MDENEKKQETGDTFVRIEAPTEIQAGDLITASEYGYHKGYMKALRDASMVMFAVVLLAVTLNTWSSREW